MLKFLIFLKECRLLSIGAVGTIYTCVEPLFTDFILFKTNLLVQAGTATHQQQLTQAQTFF